MKSNILKAIAAALVALVVAAPAIASLKTSRPQDAAAHSSAVLVPNQDAASTTLYANATALAGTVAGTTFAVTAANPSIGGRNVVLTPNDFDSDSSLIVTWRVDGYDQFYMPVSETLSTTGDTAATGEKIFAKVTQIYTTSIAGLEASDTVSLGTGSKVGITKMFSTDLHELKQASLVNAAGTGITAITVNTTNFDSTYHALKAAAFGGAVTDGDTVALLFLTDTSTPDDRYFPGR